MTKSPHAKKPGAVSKRAISNPTHRNFAANASNAISPGAGANVAALFVSGRSIYRHMPNVRSYGEREDAKTFTGKIPVVAHPPCGPWSKCLKHQYSPSKVETDKALGIWAVSIVLRNGGVLEQPADSGLWTACGLPTPDDQADAFLYTVYLEQSWFGFFSRKPTWVLVSGVPRSALPPMPITLAGEERNCMRLSKFGRARTVRPLAEWLCQTARMSWWQLNR